MSFAAREFAEDPCSSLKRGNMVRAARNLLSAVTRLLILADMVDVHLLLKSLRVVSKTIKIYRKWVFLIGREREIAMLYFCLFMRTHCIGHALKHYNVYKLKGELLYICFLLSFIIHFAS